MQMFDLEGIRDQLAKANSACWCGHVLRKDKNNFPRKALVLRVRGAWKRGYIKENLVTDSGRTE